MTQQHEVPVLDDALRRWGLVPVNGKRPLESRSAATVLHVEGPHGRAYLKVTPATAGEGPTRDARRELAFYTDVAPGLPSVAPPLLDVLAEPHGIALLISDAGRVQSRDTWTTARWARFAEIVHQVHAVTSSRDEFRVVRPLDGHLRDRIDEAEQFWGDHLSGLGEALDMVVRAVPDLTADHTFVHGDLHLDNVVCANGDDIRLTDWQQCGLGSVAADLAFVNVRLAPTGHLAPDEFLTAYAATAGHDHAELQRTTELLELATYLFVWPPFAAYNSAEGVATVRARARHLSDVLTRG